MDGIEGGQIDVPLAAIKRVRLNRNPYSASFQHPGRARVEVTTNRGHRTRYHGSLSMSARNSVFDARNAFARSTPDLDRKLVQASLGGPMLGRRSSFFVAAERLMSDESVVVNAFTAGGPLITNVPAPHRRDRLLTRLQWWPSERQTISASYTFNDRTTRNDGVGGFNLAEQGITKGDHEHKALVNYTVMLSANSRNQLLFSFKNEYGRIGNPATAPVIVVNHAFTGGPSATFLGDGRRALDVENTATWVHGRHMVLFGGRFRSDFLSAVDASNFGGTFEFSSLAQYSGGIPFVYRVNQGNPRISFSTHEVGAFVEDEMRTRKGLTLTLGLRYDWKSTVDDRNNVGPRAAFAWSPGKSKKTVVRGGVGAFYDNLPRSATLRSLLLDGVRLRELVISNPSFPDPFQSGRASLPPPSVIRVAPDVRSSCLLQTSVGVEREVWSKNTLSVEYSFLHGAHTYRSRNLNAPLPDTGLRPVSDLVNIDQIESSGFLRSHALTTTFRGRMGKLLTLHAQYVFSRSTTDSSGTFSLPANNYDLRPEIGPADFDRRHRLNLAGVLQAPKGFRMGALLWVASGAPFDITTGFDDNGDTVANDRPPGLTRNSGRGPGTSQVDVRLTKTFSVPDLRGGEGNHQRRQNLEFSVDAFNVTNHTNVSGIVGVRSSPFFGRANSASPARRLQFSILYLF
ncbi:MAG: hypothetical protein DMG07_14250 [Acidobacteria bacterium]|nr:MAG: hypothetical protein DMG07_14250 [Acidobacteriota bacterium]